MKPNLLAAVVVSVSLFSAICSASVFDDAVNRKPQVFSGNQLTFNGSKLVSNTLAEENSLGDPNIPIKKKRDRADAICKLLAPGTSAVMAQTKDDTIEQGAAAYDVSSAHLQEGQLTPVPYQELLVGSDRFSNRVFTSVSCK